MNDLLPMGISDAVAGFEKMFQPGTQAQFLRKRGFGIFIADCPGFADDFKKSLAFDEFHDKRYVLFPFLRGSDRIDRHNVGMVQLCGNLCLPYKETQRGSRNILISQHLDGNFPQKLVVSCQKHLTHAAFSDAPHLFISFGSIPFEKHILCKIHHGQGSFGT